MTPLQPNSPRTPVLGGMNGCQFAGFTAFAAAMMNRITTATLIITMTSLTVADSLMPMTSRKVTIAMIMTAGRLKIAVAVEPSTQCTTDPRAAEDAHGT